MSTKIIVVLLFLISFSQTCLSDDGVGYFVSVKGDVTLQTHQGEKKARKKTIFKTGDSITTGENAMAVVTFADKSKMKIDANTTLKVESIIKKNVDFYRGSSTFVLSAGSVVVDVVKKFSGEHSVKIKSESGIPFGVRGTRFVVGRDVNSNHYWVGVREGLVEALDFKKDDHEKVSKGNAMVLLDGEKLTKPVPYRWMGLINYKVNPAKSNFDSLFEKLEPVRKKELEKYSGLIIKREVKPFREALKSVMKDIGSSRKVAAEIKRSDDQVANALPDSELLDAKTTEQTMSEIADTDIDDMPNLFISDDNDIAADSNTTDSGTISDLAVTLDIGEGKNTSEETEGGLALDIETPQIELPNRGDCDDLLKDCLADKAPAPEGNGVIDGDHVSAISGLEANIGPDLPTSRGDDENSQAPATTETGEKGPTTQQPIGTISNTEPLSWGELENPTRNQYNDGDDSKDTTDDNDNEDDTSGTATIYTGQPGDPLPTGTVEPLNTTVSLEMRSESPEMDPIPEPIMKEPGPVPTPFTTYNSGGLPDLGGTPDTTPMVFDTTSTGGAAGSPFDESSLLFRLDQQQQQQRTQMLQSAGTENNFDTFQTNQQRVLGGSRDALFGGTAGDAPLLRNDSTTTTATGSSSEAAVPARTTTGTRRSPTGRIAPSADTSIFDGVTVNTWNTAPVTSPTTRSAPTTRTTATTTTTTTGTSGAITASPATPSTTTTLPARSPASVISPAPTQSSLSTGGTILQRNTNTLSPTLQKRTFSPRKLDTRSRIP